MTGYHFLRVVWHAWTYNKSVQNIWDAAYHPAMYSGWWCRYGRPRMNPPAPAFQVPPDSPVAEYANLTDRFNRMMR